MRIEISVEGQEPVTHKLTKDKTLLGAGSDCDILIEAEGLSRKHVVVLAEGDQYYVVDQGSTNGVFIDEERLVPGQRASFTSFFPVRLGAHVTIALLSDEESGAGGFDFAKELSAPAEKKAATKSAPSAAAPDSKAAPQSRAGFSTAPASSARRSSKADAPADKTKGSNQAEAAQTQIIKILAFVVAVGGSALFFYLKEDPAEDVAAQPVVVAKVEVPPVKLSNFEIKPLPPAGVEKAPNAINELKCSTQEELALCRGFGLPFKDYGITGAIYAETYFTVVLPALSGEAMLAFFEKDSTWDDTVKSKIQNSVDPRDLIAMFVASSPLDVWARLGADKRWMYVLFVNDKGAREGDIWVADLSYLKSLGVKSEEFFALQTSFRAQGVEALAPLAGLFRRVPAPEAPATP
jgi:hypothetical protein